MKYSSKKPNSFKKPSDFSLKNTDDSPFVGVEFLDSVFYFSSRCSRDFAPFLVVTWLEDDELSSKMLQTEKPTKIVPKFLVSLKRDDFLDFFFPSPSDEV